MLGAGAAASADPLGMSQLVGPWQCQKESGLGHAGSRCREGARKRPRLPLPSSWSLGRPPSDPLLGRAPLCRPATQHAGQPSCGPGPTQQVCTPHPSIPSAPSARAQTTATTCLPTPCPPSATKGESGPARRDGQLCGAWSYKRSSTLHREQREPERPPPPLGTLGLETLTSNGGWRSQERLSGGGAGVAVEA